MLSGCKILQYICAIIIVLLILITIMLLIGAVSASSAAASDPTLTTASGEPASTAGLAGYGTAAILIWATINIGITALFMKVYRNCAKVQDILEKNELSRKPKELAKALESMKGLAGVGKVAAESLSVSPVVEAQAAYGDQTYTPSKDDQFAK